MGIRLYPIVKKNVTESEIVGLCGSVAADLDILEQKYAAGEISTDEFYDELYKKGNEDILTLRNFQTYGWGKFRAIAEQKEEDGYVSPCGSLTEEDKVKAVLELNGICYSSIADKIEGVCWC